MDAPALITVEVKGGTYSVAARFDVGATPATALAVLTDYEQIARFMPGVRTSVVLERTSAHVVIEQEAVSKYMLFSKTVHLVLEVTEDRDTIRFIDRAGDSFTSYEGSWRVARQEPGDGDAPGATLTYALTARPAFDVPGFILTRLLQRDAGRMVDGLREEIAARAR